MNSELWEHQSQALAALRQSVGQGVKRIVLQSPTGSGKTMISAAVVEGAQSKRKRLAFVVPSIQLIDQTVEKFYAEGIRNIGVIQQQHEMTDWTRPVQVCSVQTLQSKQEFPEAQVVVIDECHELHRFHKKWLDHPDWKDVPFIGLSATPWAKGMGLHFNSLLVAATTKEMIEKGFLSKFSVYACPKNDVSGVKVVAGDYKKGELSGVMRGGTLSADIVKTWKERWGKDKTLVFAVDCAHAETLHERFLAAGVRSAYQNASTSPADRRDIQRGFHDGKYQVVCNVGTLTTGVDWDVRCLVLARPTKSEILYVQIIGRALRTAPGKDNALILDHTETTQNLGFVTDIHHDELDCRDGAEKVAERRIKPLPQACPQCASLQPRVNRTCQQCGFKLPSMNSVVEDNSVLVEFVPGKPAPVKLKDRKWTYGDKALWYAQLLGLARERGYKDGWVANKYREKFGVWPVDMKHLKPIKPSYEVSSWVLAMNIRWAKSKERERQIAAKMGGNQ